MSLWTVERRALDLHLQVGEEILVEVVLISHVRSQADLRSRAILLLSPK